MKVNVCYNDTGDTFISIILNGVEYNIGVKYDENKARDTYNLTDLCELAGYRSTKRALTRLKKYDCIGSIDEWISVGYVPDFLVKDLLNLAPCHYSKKLIRLFEKRIFSRNEFSAETMKNIRSKYSKLENRVRECLDRVEYLEQSLSLAEEELTIAKNKEMDYYERNNVKECYEFNSDYESDYESTSDESASDDDESVSTEIDSN